MVPHAPGKRRRVGRRRYPWAELLRRVFEVDVLACARCGGRRKVLAAIHDPDSIAKVLSALGLSSAVPELAPARGPSGEGEWWGA
ncbi:MAG: ATP-dependent helicase HrpA [bacterium]|nr:ATP-dependent helicase HrpA [bacterium]